MPNYEDKYVTTSVNEFNRQLMRLVDVVEGDIKNVIRKTCIDVYTAIAKRTPVDTGRARAGWGIGSTVGDYVPPEDYNDSSTPTAQRGMSEIKGEIAGFNFRISDNQVVIYNNVDYIKWLERGTSKQAPSGMIAIAVADFSRRLEENVNELRARSLM